jgi:hypothetical protein
MKKMANLPSAIPRIKGSWKRVVQQNIQRIGIVKIQLIITDLKHKKFTIMKTAKNTIRIIIERSKDLYSSYADNVEGIYGSGNTVAEAKQSALDGLNLLIKYNSPENLPETLKGDYQIIYKFDSESFFNYYKGIFTNSALEKLTGINQKQLQHYASGLKKPREMQAKKIEHALHKLGHELLEIEL